MTRGLFALDIDGVLTDGSVSLDCAGDERKVLSYRDIDAVFRARREGLLVSLLTAEGTPMAEKIAERLQVDHFEPACRDKRSVLQGLAKDLGLPTSVICFIGDSAKDAGAIEFAGLGLAPQNADATARGVADRILSRPGGEGAVAEGLDLFLTHLGDSVKVAQPESRFKVSGLDQMRDSLSELTAVLEELGKSGLEEVFSAGQLLRQAIETGGTILIFGNGGSAADAQHMAAEIIGFFRGAPGVGRAIALSADSALLTALANDGGYDQVFSRQIRLHARPKDVAVAFTTSGRSESIVEGLASARERGLPTIVITGAGAPAELKANVRIEAPSTDTQRIQEVHGLIIHLLCQLCREGTR